MKRFASILTGTLLVGGLVFSQDKPTNKEPQLPKSVQEILTKTEKDALNLRTTYEEGLQKIYLKTEKDLNKELENILKSNSSTKLEDAVAVKEKIQTFKKEISEKMDEKGRDNLLANDGKKEIAEKKSLGNVEKKIIGKWKKTNSLIEIRENMSCTYNSSLNGIAKLVNKNKIEIVWDNRKIYTLVGPFNGNEIKGSEGSEENGLSFVLTKEKSE